MQIFRLPSVKGKAGDRSDASVFNAIRAGLFTTGVAIGQRIKGWPDYEVNALISARIAGKAVPEVPQLVKILRANRIDPANALATV